MAYLLFRTKGIHVFYLILETHGERVVIRIGVMNRTKGTCLFQVLVR